jgi:hypothetical protein
MENQNQSTGALLKWVPTLASKADIQSAATELTQAVHRGDIDAKEAAVALDTMTKVLKAAIDDIDELVLTELGKYTKGERIKVGAIELQPRETGIRYDYSACSDPELDELLVQLYEVNEAIKVRQELLKAIKAPTTVVDPVTGEVITLQPPRRTSTSSYAIIYPKG